MQMQSKSLHHARRWLGVLAAATVVFVSAPALAQQDQNQLVTSAQTTFSDFQRDPDMTWFRANVGKARAVLIAPEIVKAGWIFGGSGSCRAVSLMPTVWWGRVLQYRRRARRICAP